MKFRKFGTKFILRIDKGEEIIETLRKFCAEQKIALGTVTGIGATDRAVIGLFDTQEKKYYSSEISGDREISPLLGNISTMDGKPYLHIHANLCDKSHQCLGGHLNSAVVSATFEAVIEKFEGKADRYFDKEIGLNLYRF